MVYICNDSNDLFRTSLTLTLPSAYCMSVYRNMSIHQVQHINTAKQYPALICSVSAHIEKLSHADVEGFLAAILLLALLHIHYVITKLLSGEKR